MRRLTELVEGTKIALAAIRANKLRGALTTLGIVIGIVGVVTTLTAANGLATSFRQNASVIGSDVLYLSRTPWVHNGRWFQFRNRPPITLRESHELERILRSAKAINPTAQTQRRVAFGSESLGRIDIIGTTDKHLLVSTAVPAVGRFLTPLDVRYKENVCVIGSEIQRRLFGSIDPLGRVLHIGSNAFRIVGVMEKQGSMGFFGGPNFDSQVLIPITTFAKLFGAFERDLSVAVKAPSPEAVTDFESELIGQMRKIRRLRPAEKDDFAVNRLDSLLEMFGRIMGVILLIGSFVTGISLVVGGIGVANILFVSVTERTREIGVRKAMGAPRRAILIQFLLEAATICLGGGLVGLAIAWGVAKGLTATILPASLSPAIALLAIGIALGVGLLAGIVPAWRASRMDPVDALRWE